MVVGSIITYVLDVVIPNYDKTSSVKTILQMSGPKTLDDSNLVDKYINNKSKPQFFWEILSNASVACAPIAFMSKNVNLLGGFLLILTLIDFLHMIYKYICRVHIDNESYEKLKKQKIHKSIFHEMLIIIIIIIILFWAFMRDNL